MTYLRSKSFVVKYKRNEAGRILIFDVTIDETDYISINVYNSKQIKVLINLHLLNSLDIHQNKQKALAVDFNLFLDTMLEGKRGSPYLKTMC